MAEKNGNKIPGMAGETRALSRKQMAESYLEMVIPHQCTQSEFLQLVQANATLAEVKVLEEINTTLKLIQVTLSRLQ